MATRLPVRTDPPPRPTKGLDEDEWPDLSGGPGAIGFGGGGGGFGPGGLFPDPGSHLGSRPTDGLVAPDSFLPPTGSEKFFDANPGVVDRLENRGINTKPPPRQRGESTRPRSGGGEEGSSGGPKWNADEYLDPQSAAWLRDLLGTTDTSEREALARAEQEKALARGRADTDARAGMAGMGLVGGQIALGNQMQRESASALADQILGIKEGARKEDFQRGSFATQMIDRGTQRGQDDEMMRAIMEALGVGDDDGDGAEPEPNKNPLTAEWRQSAKAHFETLPGWQQNAYMVIAGPLGMGLGFGADLAYWAHQNGMSLEDIKNWLAADPGNAARLANEIEGAK